MVNLRSRGLAPLDYNQLHNSGTKTTARNHLFTNVEQDHGYCISHVRQPPAAKDPGSPVRKRWDEARPGQNPEWDTVLRRKALDPNTMDGLLGQSLRGWEQDPEIAERIQSLSEVLGLAKDLNISIEGFGLQDCNSDNMLQSDMEPRLDETPMDVPEDVMDFLMEASVGQSSSPSRPAQCSSSQSETEFLPGIGQPRVKNIRQQTSSQQYQSHGKSSAKNKSKRGRKPAKIDVKAKLERSRQSARECRARKKLRYQYLEELVSSRERAVFQLRSEMEQFKKWAADLDSGLVPPGLEEYLDRERQRKERSTSESSVNRYVIRSRRRLTTDRTDSESSISSNCPSVPNVQSPLQTV